ncbi:ribosome rescue protein RqcH [Methanococcus maripaludis]|jgi:predicted ribosome quality control (RQC) complex YloA/Tae2 family protein|uniref:Archaeal Rqc2 homolog aRqcH n=2 Tax=Methanococcus maripaludis TaxID=39152 RepID=A0A8T3W605_METMI|nr:ribosome rescue protein RqcH [Methanococcus maripaludis]AEK20060.1 Fibronectin-binding A domain protein [Methanococcus maripaludis X1]MBG0768623.1 NFACT family protein [Methanococcus maripaludis]
MKTEMTNVDISAAVSELQKVINGKLDKAFLVNNQDGKELILKVHIPEIGSREIAIGLGKYKYITLTEYEREKPRNPPSFVMLLRKHLKNIKITSVAQHNFDRIVIFNFEWNELKYKLIIELFGDGNAILLDSEDKIILPLKIERWSTRKIVPKELYKFPPQKDLDPKNLDYSLAKKLFIEEFEKEENKDTEVVRIISRTFGLAGVYSEEICLNSEIDKNLKNPKNEEIEKLFEGSQSFFKKVFGELKPKSTLKNGEFVNIDPIDLKIHENLKENEIKHYESFLTALDEYFSRFIMKKEIKQAESKLQKLVKKQERILKSQLDTKDKYEKQSISNHKRGDLIYANYSLVDEIVSTIKDAREKMDWNGIKNVIKENKTHPILSKIINVNEKNAELTLKLSADYGNGLIEDSVPVDLRKNAFENADIVYQKSKKFKNKVQGVIEALKISEKKLAELKEKEKLDSEVFKEKEEKIKKKERKVLKWYEKLKWTVIGGYLIVAGKDATTNEMLIKRYVEKNDIVFHTLMEGAPFTIIRTEGSEEIPDENIMFEVAKFAASHSRAWKLGIGSADVYWVRPDQISKTAESGEYLKKGAFVIRGKRNFIRSAALELGIGIINYDGKLRLTTAPESVAKENFEKCILLKPGKLKKSDLVKELLKEFSDFEVDDEDILRALPPGETEIKLK